MAVTPRVVVLVAVVALLLGLAFGRFATPPRVVERVVEVESTREAVTDCEASP